MVVKRLLILILPLKSNYKITGIGDKKADLILQYRQEHGSFNSVDDLKNINGFGEKTVTKLKPMLAV